MPEQRHFGRSDRYPGAGKSAGAGPWQICRRDWQGSCRTAVVGCPALLRSTVKKCGRAPPASAHAIDVVAAAAPLTRPVDVRSPKPGETGVEFAQELESRQIVLLKRSPGSAAGCPASVSARRFAAISSSRAGQRQFPWLPRPTSTAWSRVRTAASTSIACAGQGRQFRHFCDGLTTQQGPTTGHRHCFPANRVGTSAIASSGAAALSEWRKVQVQ